MKKIFLTLFIASSLSMGAWAQKFAYVDSDYILEKIPEYAAAQKELDELSVQWQKEIEAKYADIDQLYKDYQAEQILLTDEMKKKRQEIIVNKEKEVKDLQKAKFGVDGELYKKRQELIKPIQDKIYDAMKSVAIVGGYMMIFDKAGETNILYSNPKYDQSDDVLKKLGIKVDTQ